MADLHHIRAGAKIAALRRRRYTPNGEAAFEKRELEVRKVGRDYLYAVDPGWQHTEYRFRRDNGAEANGYSVDQWAFPDMDALEHELVLRERRATLFKLSNAHGLRLDRLTIEQLETAIALFEIAAGKGVSNG